jgi:hypothetical protein
VGDHAGSRCGESSFLFLHFWGGGREKANTRPVPTEFIHHHAQNQWSHFFFFLIRIMRRFFLLFSSDALAVGVQLQTNATPMQCTLAVDVHLRKQTQRIAFFFFEKEKNSRAPRPLPLFLPLSSVS